VHPGVRPSDKRRCHGAGPPRSPGVLPQVISRRGTYPGRAGKREIGRSFADRHRHWVTLRSRMPRATRFVAVIRTVRLSSRARSPDNVSHDRLRTKVRPLAGVSPSPMPRLSSRLGSHYVDRLVDGSAPLSRHGRGTRESRASRSIEGPTAKSPLKERAKLQPAELRAIRQGAPARD